MKRLFLIDAYALVFKYYYAFFGRPMRNRAGMNTSILFGFTKFLRDIQRREHPDLLGVALDPKGGCFRCELYPEYKANRPATPEDIIASVPYLRRLLQAMRIPIYEIPGYEADHVIGTLAHRASSEGYDVYMVTPDKDYGQLVGLRRAIYKQKGDGVEIIREEQIREKYGIDDPVLVRDILAIWGDASDNIPGVPGIGEKGACKIVGEWGDVETILANAQSIKGKQGEKIRSWGDKLLLSKRLASICTDVPVEFSAEDLEVCEPNYDELRALYTELDFTSFLREMPSQAAAPVVAAEPEAVQRPAKRKAAMDGQGDLFAMMATPEPTATVASTTPAAEEPAEGAEQPFASINDTPHKYHLVTELADLQSLVERISRYDEFCFDTETTGFDLYRDRIVGLSLAVEPHEAWYVSFTPENTAAFAGVCRPASFTMACMMAERSAAGVMI